MRFLNRLRGRRVVRKYLSHTGSYTRGDSPVMVALTSGVAREVYVRATHSENRSLAALVEPCIPQGGKIVVAVADRAMIRRLMRDAKVV